jgi:hypothetical protein
MAFPYALYGGATRSDAITGLNQAFSNALLQLYAAAPPEVQRELGLNSAYRSPAVQAALYEKSDKSGRNVAPPGKSRHNFGEAADLYGFGLTKDAVSQATKDWVHQNAANFGLTFPMAHEPWHIQLARSQGQAGPGAASSAAVAALPTPAADVLSDALVPANDRRALADFDVSGAAAKAMAGAQGESMLGVGAGEAAPIPELAASSAAIDPRAFAQRWEAGAGRNLRQPQDLADLFKVRESIGTAGTPSRIPIRRF